MISHSILPVVTNLLQMDVKSLKADTRRLATMNPPVQHPKIITLHQQMLKITGEMTKEFIAEKQSQQAKYSLEADVIIPYYVERMMAEVKDFDASQLQLLMTNLNAVVDARFNYAELIGNEISANLSPEEHAIADKAQTLNGQENYAMTTFYSAMNEALLVKQEEIAEQQKNQYAQFCATHMLRFQHEIMAHIYKQKSFSAILANAKLPVVYSSSHDYSSFINQLADVYYANLDHSKNNQSIGELNQAAVNPDLLTMLTAIKKSETLCVALEKHTALHKLQIELKAPIISAITCVENYIKARDKQLEVFSKRRDSVGMKVFMWLAKSFSLLLPKSFFRPKIQNEVIAQQKSELKFKT